MLSALIAATQFMRTVFINKKAQENKVEKQESEKSKKLKQELESMGLFSAMKNIKKNYNK